MKGQDRPRSSGIIVGFNKIPVEKEVLTRLRGLQLDPDHVTKCVEANRHNNATTTYYLFLKKYLS